MCLAGRQLKELRTELSVFQQKVLQKLSVLEDTVMAWINAVSGAAFVLAKAPIAHVGANKHNFLRYQRPNDTFVFVPFSTYSNTKSDESMAIYKNNAIVATEKINDVTSTSTSGQLMTSPVVCIPGADKCFWIKGYGNPSSYDTFFYLYEFSFSTYASTLLETINGEARGTIPPCWWGGVPCYDPIGDKLYVVLGSGNRNASITYYTRLEVRRYTTSGVLEDVAMLVTNSSGSTLQRCVTSAVAYNGTVYFGYLQISGSTASSVVASVDGTGSGASSFTSLSSTTWTSTSFGPVFLPIDGLYINSSSASLVQPGGDTWNLSSYIETTNRSIGLVRKTSAGYEVLTRTSTTVYYLQLNTGGTVTVLASRSVSSDMSCYQGFAPTYLHEFLTTGSFPKGVCFGSAKNFLELNFSAKEAI